MITCPRRIIWSCLLAVGLLSFGGCRTHQPDDASRRLRTPPSPAPAAHRIREISRQSIRLEHGRALGVAGSAEGLAYQVIDSHRDRLYRIDYQTGMTREVLTSGAPIYDIKMDDRWLAWGEQEREQTDALEPVRWRLKVLDTRSGVIRTVARSPSRTPLPPGFALSGDTLLYSPYHGLERGTVDVRAVSLTTGNQRTVVRDQPVGGVVQAGRDLIGIVTWDRGRQPGQSKSDLFVVNRNPMARITTSGKVADVQLYGDVLAWDECGKATCTLMYRTWPTGTARPVLTSDDTMIFLGHGFASIRGRGETDDGVSVVPLDDPNDAITLRQPTGHHLVGYPTAWGDRVVWVAGTTDDPDKADLLVIATMATDAQ